MVVNALWLPSDRAGGRAAQWKQSRREEGDSPGSLSSVSEEAGLAGNSVRPASRSHEKVTRDKCGSTHSPHVDYKAVPVLRSQ